jgi:branched-chain amino acid transport system permease protein
MDFFWHIVITIAHTLPTFLGYNLVFGRGKILHFGPYGVSIAGAYALFLTLMHTQNYALAILAGLAVALTISLLFAFLSLRLTPDSFGVMSIAMHLAMIAVVLNFSFLTRGALGLPSIPRLPFLEEIEALAITAIAIAIGFAFLFYRLEHSSFGRALTALAEHEWHAKSLGVNRTKVTVIAFLLLAVAHVHGNFFYGQHIQFVHPNDFQFSHFVFLIMVIVAGGPGSMRGVILSAVLITLLKEGIRFVPLMPDVLGPIRLILFGLILFGAVWWRRDALFPKQRTV